VYLNTIPTEGISTCFVNCMFISIYFWIILVGVAIELPNILSTHPNLSEFKHVKAKLVFLDPPYGWELDTWDGPDDIWSASYWLEVSFLFVKTFQSGPSQTVTYM
jgi:hypothetical protein